METREIYWNIGGIWAMYGLFVLTLAVFGYGVWRQYRLIARGKPENRFEKPGERWRTVGLHALAQLRSLRDQYSGSMHLLFFWGFVALTIGTLVVLLEADLGLRIMHGQFYLYFQSLALDLFGLLAIVGVAMAILKRYLFMPDRLHRPGRLHSLLEDGGILVIFLVVLVTGFVLEGARIVATNDPWGDWSPVGKATGLLLSGAGIGTGTLESIHRYSWWFHLLLAFGFLAVIPYTKLRHLLLSPANIYFRSLQPKGALQPIDVETAETLGRPRYEEFTWKQLLDLESCVECGRCQAVCPASITDQPLSPKAVILDLRNGLYDISAKPAEATNGASRDEAAGAPTVAASTPEAIWSCVTCRACMRECPLYIEHVPAIVDMRRYLVMEQAEYPEMMQEALKSLEDRGHPFRGTTAGRMDWCEGLGLKVVAESGPAEWLYWVGCAAAFDERNQKVARAFATVMQRAGVDFAILGEEESCTGDVARRVGNEYLYQMMAQQNVGLLNGYEVTKIITTCPHCYNTLKNEYPQFGGNYEVYHHTELLDEWIREGRLNPTHTPVASLTFHDSCYLTRHNDVIDPPRQVLGSVPGLTVKEMERSRDATFCCGGGGGHLWFEEYEGRRINHERADQALALGTEAIGTSCPFCMIMLTDGVNARKGDREAGVQDLAELVEKATRPLQA